MFVRKEMSLAKVDLEASGIKRIEIGHPATAAKKGGAETELFSHFRMNRQYDIPYIKKEFALLLREAVYELFDCIHKKAGIVPGNLANYGLCQKA
jgi:hypothetical protein